MLKAVSEYNNFHLTGVLTEEEYESDKEETMETLKSFKYNIVSISPVRL